MDKRDYYELLQISPTAQPETIHRVYRFLAARVHPDNAETGDLAEFVQLREAYGVLSDPDRRAIYDSNRQQSDKVPLSTWVDFMDSVQGELNRRLAVLSVLYTQRGTNSISPELSTFDLENRLGFPRDYLEFTTWYLSTKGYVARGDNASFAITAEGVDFVESQRMSMPLLDKLLTTGETFPADSTEVEAAD